MFRRFEIRPFLGVALLLGGAALSIEACAGDEPLSPVHGSGTGGSPVTPTSVPPPDAGPPKRTVIQHNPFGNVAETQNLLFDGDFEWSSPFSDEYGWYQGVNPVLSEVVVGADCRSGIKCARVAKHQSIDGIAVALHDVDLVASVWVRFDDPTTPCTSASATVIDKLAGQVPFNVPDADVHLAASDAPDQLGWCKLSAIVPKRRNKPYLNVHNLTGGNMLVDDAVLKAMPAPPPPGGPKPPPPPETFAPAWVPTAEEARNLDEARAVIREYDKPHDGPKTDAQKAFEKAHAGEFR